MRRWQGHLWGDKKGSPLLGIPRPFMALSVNIQCHKRSPNDSVVNIVSSGAEEKVDQGVK